MVRLFLATNIEPWKSVAPPLGNYYDLRFLPFSKLQEGGYCAVEKHEKPRVMKSH